MVDLNDLRVFERVAALRSFSAASRVLEIPKSTVSRSIQRLEARIASPLMQRTTREVRLTEAGVALQARCADLINQLEESIQHVSALRSDPHGSLRISAGIGFSVEVLGELLPRFAQRYPKIDVVLDLSSDVVDLVGDRVDVAIRMGPMPDSTIVAKRLGVIHRYLCASPAYVAQRGTPATFEALHDHDLLDIPGAHRATWIFQRAEERVQLKIKPRFAVNCALTIHRMVLNGAGIGQSSGYLCGPEIQAGRLVRLFADWGLPSVPVHAVFPSHRERAPIVRTFIEFMRDDSRDGPRWQVDPLD